MECGTHNHLETKEVILSYIHVLTILYSVVRTFEKMAFIKFSVWLEQKCCSKVKQLVFKLECSLNQPRPPPRGVNSVFHTVDIYMINTTPPPPGRSEMWRREVRGPFPCIWPQRYLLKTEQKFFIKVGPHTYGLGKGLGASRFCRCATNADWHPRLAWIALHLACG